jgi:hypothetical protein
MGCPIAADLQQLVDEGERFRVRLVVMLPDRADRAAPGKLC